MSCIPPSPFIHRKRLIPPAVKKEEHSCCSSCASGGPCEALPSADTIRSKALDPLGGQIPSDIERAKKVDLITLPLGMEGTNCGNCLHINSEKFCEHPEVQMYVNSRMCCAVWSHPDAIRAWEEGTVPERKYLTKDRGQPCKQGEASARTGCIPKSKKPSGQRKPSKKKPQAESKKPAKIRAVRGKMTTAKRIGKGKDAKVILADGSPAPAHIQPAMIPPAWSSVKISLDPEADVLVTGKAKDKKGRMVNKTVYNDTFHARTAAAKFTRTQEGVKWSKDMADQVQKDRQNEATKNEADAVWLMMEQATRPGSEADTKGVTELFDKPMSVENIQGDENKMTIQIEGSKIPIKDAKTRKEIARRIKAGESLEDSTFWLKSHGATTLEGRHVVEAEDGVRLQFVGKEGVWHDHLIRNPELAEMLLSRKQNAGDKGNLFGSSYANVSKYASTLDDGKFTPKDLRTIKATKLATELVNANLEPPADEEEYKTRVKQVAEKVSSVLGNRAVQALESYIDPMVFTAWRV